MKRCIFRYLISRHNKEMKLQKAAVEKFKIEASMNKAWFEEELRMRKTLEKRILLLGERGYFKVSFGTDQNGDEVIVDDPNFSGGCHGI